MNNEIIEVHGQDYTATVVSEIKELLNKSRNTVAMHVNNELLATYWKIGEVIVKYEFFIFAISNCQTLFGKLAGHIIVSF